ncbi:MAG: carbamoyltransferase HypF [bacterium]
MPAGSGGQAVFVNPVVPPAEHTPVQSQASETWRWILGGQVQGVGFRPFVYRLAHALSLSGSVRNLKGQVEVVATGTGPALQQFEHQLIQDAPAIAIPVIESRTKSMSVAVDSFQILDSDASEDARIQVPVDYFICEDCLAEMQDRNDRRYRYPFTNCTQCGPRYTLIKSLPYDRTNTSMADFPLCAECAQEYQDPLNRRFHAEPIACPVCGPSLWFSDDNGETTGNEEALAAAITRLQAGAILAVRGIGGYHLMCDAGNHEAVARLRVRKQRPDKPLAVMLPQDQDDPLVWVHKVTIPGMQALQRLQQPDRPIVLCKKRANDLIADNVAPGLNELGVMLPYSPLHQLLLTELGRPLVATSGNLSGEPVMTEAPEAERRLAPLCDGFLHHNRDIVRPADDSVLRDTTAGLRCIRVGRGMSPMEFSLPVRLKHPVLALGGHLKNTVTLAWENRAVMSAHIGDMGSVRSLKILETLIEDLQSLYEVNAHYLLVDHHPDYATHRWAADQSISSHSLWHHHCHASALAAEHSLDDCLLALTWDGVGYGRDGTLWGGEGFVGSPGHWNHFSSFDQFRLPGADKAGREPWRSAAALCWKQDIEYQTPVDSSLLKVAWQQRLNAPKSSAVGRIFDGVAALTGVCEMASYEGQGPMMLEAIATDSADFTNMPFQKDKQGVLRAQWSALVARMGDIKVPAEVRAGEFHESLSQHVLDIARQARQQHHVRQVGLCGGVFQNARLLTRSIELLEADGFEPLTGMRVPVNDGGLSLGQVLEYAYGSH